MLIFGRRTRSGTWATSTQLRFQSAISNSLFEIGHIIWHIWYIFSGHLWQIFSRLSQICRSHHTVQEITVIRILLYLLKLWIHWSHSVSVLNSEHRTSWLTLIWFISSKSLLYLELLQAPMSREKNGKNKKGWFYKWSNEVFYLNRFHVKRSN